MLRRVGNPKVPLNTTVTVMYFQLKQDVKVRHNTNQMEYCYKKYIDNTNIIVQHGVNIKDTLFSRKTQ